MTLPQICSAIAGSVCCVSSVYAFVRKETRQFKALFWFAIGLTMIFAAFRPQMIVLLGEDSSELRLRLVVALLSFVVVTVCLESVRVSRMQERYAFLWLVTAALLFCGAAFEGAAEFVPRLTGMSYGATVTVVLFAFIMFMLFHVSLALSRLQLQLSQVSQALALSEERLRALQEGRGRRGPVPLEEAKAGIGDARVPVESQRTNVNKEPLS
jgi:hypothetical protein